tara:strand:+ start:10258 stop:10965 length:708 start_codon:yes stop_codon:yes gene_type:complete
MLIGEDFSKIQVDLNGLILLEPNAIISDFIMALASFFIASKLYQKRRSHGFVKYWYYFFLTFALGAILGSIGHGLFYYLGPQGKFPTWISAILSTYFIEKAMIKSYERYNKNNTLGKIAFFKMIFVFLLVITVISSAEFDRNHTIGFLPIAINTILGVLISVSIIGTANIKNQRGFQWLLIGVLAMLPSAAIFLMKINLFQWFDKGDLSHIFMTIGVCLYYVGVKKIDAEKAPFV